MPPTTDQLIAGTIRRDAGALCELLARLRPHCARKLFERFGYLRDEQADLLDEAESLLFEWSLSPQARELLPPGESLSNLAFRLLSRVIQERRRQERRSTRLTNEMAAAGEFLGRTTEADAFGTEEVVAALVSLPQAHQEVLLAELRFQIGDGPPLAEVPAARPGTARMRLSRARAAMLKALAGDGAAESLEIDHG